jgi:glycerophosphoryl diester phosphodiesterase
MIKQILDDMYQGRTLVLGHRGARAYAPMNTLPAFELAVQQGADGIELDVHRSKDGYPVIVHDFTVDETTDGRGQVTEMTLAELKALDAGAWFGEAFRGTRIPTLDEVFEAVGKKVRVINVEIKFASDKTDGVEQVVADCITRHNMQTRVIISSFNPITLHRFRSIMPDVPIGFLYMGDQTWNQLMNNLPHEARHPYHEMIDAAYMEQARADGYRVNTWTVNDPVRAVELRNLGVDSIITDNPDTIIGALRG